MKEQNQKGLVWIIGAGPGAKKLLTVKAVECMADAEVIVYDRLLGEGVLEYANPKAELIFVGKEPGRHQAEQWQINRILIEKALTGKKVARVKGGDPFVFGRGGEEAVALAGRGIPFEIVPGVSAAIAAPAYAGIPVTHRECCSAFHVITGHENPEKPESRINYSALAAVDGTLVFLMGVGHLAAIVANLLAHGKDPETPAAVIQRGTTLAQQVVTAKLRDLAVTTAAAGIGSPAVIVIGPVVDLREQINWFPRGPLSGKRILVTRTREQSGPLTRSIETLGGEALECPMIRIVAANLPDREELRNVLPRLGEFTWIIFTSVPGVEFFWRMLQAEQIDLRSLAGLKFGVIGGATAEVLWSRGIKADLVPSEYTSAALAAALVAQLTSGDKVLLIRAKNASKEIPWGLARAGIFSKEVTAYQTLPNERAGEELAEYLRHGPIDILTFTSSSTVRCFSNLWGAAGPEWLDRSKVVCIGPVTARTAAELGLRVDAVAGVHTIEGMVTTILTMERRAVSC
ncbi:MAG: uroporphyrinogen-III C-methyltransferase [Bacillota bacterium]|jgi:uroporphyrinogen III methyltransferase/synthase